MNINVFNIVENNKVPLITRKDFTVWEKLKFFS